uniref:Uncharacterized protein n=1 Tax=Anguilla anguilla TaxID=7936 RepID=A0A0E9WEY5_ANGAN
MYNRFVYLMKNTFSTHKNARLLTHTTHYLQVINSNIGLPLKVLISKLHHVTLNNGYLSSHKLNKLYSKVMLPNVS